MGASQKGLYDFIPSGFVGLDPYDISNDTIDYGFPLQFPTFDWGFAYITCFVQVKKAARGAYELSSLERGRVLYLINKNQYHDMIHCIFTDDGCGRFVCPTKEQYDWVYESVAKSLHSFMNALKTVDGTPFQKKEFKLPSTLSGDIFLYANDDNVYGSIDNGEGNDGRQLIAAMSIDTSIENDKGGDGGSDGIISSGIVLLLLLLGVYYFIRF